MKKIAITVIGLGVFGIGYYSYRKYKAAKEIISKLKVIPKKIKEVKLSLEQISFLLDVELQNDSQYDLGMTASSLLRLQQIDISTPNGKRMASIDTNNIQIQIPAYGSTLISNIEVVIPTANLLGEIPTIATHIQQSALVYHLSINAFGKEFKITT